MKRLGAALLLFSILLIAGCSDSKSPGQKEAVPSALGQESAGLVLSSEGPKWSEDKDAEPFDQVIAKAPFNIKQPSVPFKVTRKSASKVKVPFDLIQMIYANEELGVQLVLGESNSKDKSKPEGRKGAKLQNGAQTWIQSGESFSALYWRYEGLTYALASYKTENGTIIPLYDENKLLEIANTIR